MKLKSLFPLMILVMIVAFTGCKKGPDKLITKTWKVTNVMSKGVINDSVFQDLKAQLSQAEMTFKDNKYTMTSGGKTIETGSYALDNGKLVVKTEQGMNMDAVVTAETLTLDTPDFMIHLQPK
jgi:hypothetical protein